MKQLSSHIQIKVLAGVLILFLAVAYILKPIIDHEFHELYSENLNRIQPLSKQLALDIFQAANGDVLHYDYIEADLSKLEKASELSLYSPTFVSGSYRGNRDAIITQYQLQLAEIRTDVDKIKSLIGLVRNSDLRARSILQEINATTPGSEILAGLFEYQQLRDKGASSRAVEVHLNQLIKTSPEYLENIRDLMPHAALLARYEPVLSRLISETSSVILDISLPIEMKNAYLAQHAKAISGIKFFLWFVAIVGAICILLLSTLIMGFFKNRKTQIQAIEVENSELLKALDERNKLGQQSSVDPLTGVYNRRAFRNLFSERLDVIEKTNVLALAVLDIDNFKLVNDGYGHEVGDKVLQMISIKLHQVIKGEGLIGRLGDDEFAVLLDAPSKDELLQKVSAIFNDAAVSLSHNGESFNTVVSVGAVEVDNSKELDDLISDAFVALQFARKSGQGQASWYTKKLRDDHDSYSLLSNELEQAINDGRIEQLYQPVVDLQNADVVGLKVLSRWSHPEAGDIPTEILPEIARNADLFNKLNNSFLEASIGKLQELHENNQKVNLHVDLSAYFTDSAYQGALSDLIINLLERRGIAPEFLTVEISVTRADNDVLLATNALQSLADYGVKIYLNNFGVGSSSLMLLHKLPINALTIDSTFVDRLTTDQQANDFVKTVMTIAKSLNLEVAAEGITKSEQLEMLHTLECNLGRGSIFSDPVKEPSQAVNIFNENRKAA